MIPEDPAILFSFVNMKLRDHYKSLDEFCEDMDVDRQEITDKLGEIGCYYDEEKNKFM